MLWAGASASAWWYLVLKNFVAEAEPPPGTSTRGHKYGHVWSDAASSPAALRSLRRTARYASVTRLAGEALRRSKRTRSYGRMY